MAKLKPVTGRVGSMKAATGTLADHAAKASAEADKENGTKTHEEIVESKASQADARMRAKLRKKKHFSLGEIPEFVVDEFDILRQSLGMEKREYFYHLLREAGADIPEYSKMDGRRY